jgi:hypothetical protein
MIECPLEAFYFFILSNIYKVLFRITFMLSALT